MPQTIDDLANATRQAMSKKGSYQDISFGNQSYCASRIKQASGMPEKSGLEVTFMLVVDRLGNARPSGLFDTMRIGNKNLMKKGTVPWTKVVGGWMYDVDESEFQGDAEEIVSVMEVRAHSARMDLHELDEDMLFQMPSGPDDIASVLLGLPYWFVLDDTSEGGFHGKNPAGFPSGAGGINAETYEGWRNWCFGFDVVEWDDFVKKILKAMWATDFESPDPYKQEKTGRKGWTVESTYTVVEEGQALLRRSNDEVKNLADFKNVMLGSNSIRANSWLTNNTQNDPLYAVNYEYCGFEYLKGRANIWEKPMVRPGTDTVRDVPYRSWRRFRCLNRRQGGFVAGRR